MAEAEQSAAATNINPEAIKGAQAVASAIFWARNGKEKRYIKSHLEQDFGYDFSQSLDRIRSTYKFDKTNRGSVPQAITAFLDSIDFEDAIRKAVSIGGESSAIACMAGGIAQAYYGQIPEYIQLKVRGLLTPSLLRITDLFAEKFGSSNPLSG